VQRCAYRTSLPLPLSGLEILRGYGPSGPYPLERITGISECDAIFSGCRFWKQSPGHHSSTTFSLGPLVCEIGSDHILHGDTHSLIYGDLAIAKSACLPTKSHCTECCSRGEIQTREFAATNRRRLKSVQRLDKQSLPSC